MCRLSLLLLSLALVSCQQALFPNPPRSQTLGRGGTVSREDTTAVPVPPDDPLPDLYATALCFPDDTASLAYDVVLFKNGREVLRVPFQGRPEPERHRICQGRLWTDEWDGSEMVVRCDGKERFRYAGDELYRGFLVVNGIVYTLGQRQGREGLSFRINGEERFSAPSGTILGGPGDSEWEGGAFSRDSAGVCYTYGLPFRKGNDLSWEYKVMREEELLKMIPAGTAEKLFDIRVHEGIVYRTELRSSARNSYCLVKDETYLAVDIGETEVPHYCKLVPLDGRLLIKGYSTGVSSSKGYTFWLRNPADIPYIAIDNQPIRDLLTDGTHQAYLVENGEGLIRTVYLDREVIPFTSDRYRLPSSRCAQLSKGILGLALSSPDGREHLLIQDREVTALHFNGYFTSVLIY